MHFFIFFSKLISFRIPHFGNLSLQAKIREIVLNSHNDTGVIGEFYQEINFLFALDNHHYEYFIV